MPVNRKALRSFLVRHAQNPDRVPEAMKLLDPFFRRAESGRYPLAPAKKLDRKAMKDAIAKATDKPLAEVVFISLTHPFPKPDWMAKSVCQDIFWGTIGVSIDNMLGDSLVESSSEGIDWRSFGDDLRDSLEDSLRESLEDSLREGFRGSLGNSPGVDSFERNLEDSLIENLEYILRDNFGVNSVERNLEDGLQESIFSYLGFTILNDAEQIERFTPLIRLLPKAIPIGKKKGEPCTWLVLVA